jgi:hypothetical protein
MTTHDTPEAALEAAIHASHFGGRRLSMTDAEADRWLAAAILAALPPGWCGHEAQIGLDRGLAVRSAMEALAKEVGKQDRTVSVELGFSEVVSLDAVLDLIAEHIALAPEDDT